MKQKFQAYQASLESELGCNLLISGLAGDLCIFQRTDGHRHSIDDAATSWYALKKRNYAETLLDLGSGLGSVGLAVLWGSKPEAKLTCIEAQEQSYKLLKANIFCNQLEEKVEAIHSDIREIDLKRTFSLITGSPPYFEKDKGVLPQDSQKAYARFELRGHVGDYAKVAKRHMDQESLFVFCFPFQQKQRCFSLVKEAGLNIFSVQDVVPRSDRAPLFSLYAASLRDDMPLLEEPALIVADNEGKYTEAMLELQKSRGFGQLGTNKF